IIIEFEGDPGRGCIDTQPSAKKKVVSHLDGPAGAVGVDVHVDPLEEIVPDLIHKIGVAARREVERAAPKPAVFKGDFTKTGVAMRIKEMEVARLQRQIGEAKAQ